MGKHYRRITEETPVESDTQEEVTIEQDKPTASIEQDKPTASVELARNIKETSKRLEALKADYAVAVAAELEDAPVVTLATHQARAREITRMLAENKR